MSGEVRVDQLQATRDKVHRLSDEVLALQLNLKHSEGTDATIQAQVGHGQGAEKAKEGSNMDGNSAYKIDKKSSLLERQKLRKKQDDLKYDGSADEYNVGYDLNRLKDKNSASDSEDFDIEEPFGNSSSTAVDLSMRRSESSSKNVTMLEKLNQIGGTDPHAFVGTPFCSTCRCYLNSMLDKQDCLMSGFLGKKKGMQMVRHKRWFILASKHLAYYVHPEDFGVTIPHGVIHLDGCLVLDLNPEGSEFVIQKRRKMKLNLKAADVFEKKQWINSLRANDSTYTKGVNMDKISDLGHFCTDCNRYINMDDFTLAELDGYLFKFRKARSTFAKKWVVFAGNHIAYYDDLEEVCKYQPTKVLHVNRDRVLFDDTDIDKKQHKGELIFKIKSGDREYVFKTVTADQYKDWISCLKKKQ